MNNDKLNETRPFNLEYAKAGAPYACRDGDTATITKFDGRNHPYSLVGHFGELDIPTAWRADGSHSPGYEQFDLVMTPLGRIEGKPVFMGDIIIGEAGRLVEVRNPGFKRWENCLWPAPEKQYPVTGMSDDDMRCAVAGVPPISNVTAAWRAVANAALRHAIDSGQVIALDQHVREIGEAIAEEGRADRAARDMAIARAVRDICEGVTENKQWQSLIRSFDLAAVVAGVKP